MISLICVVGQQVSGCGFSACRCGYLAMSEENKGVLLLASSIALSNTCQQKEGSLGAVPQPVIDLVIRAGFLFKL